MAKRELTNMLAKRELLYSEKTTDEERNAAADGFIEKERYGEALEFLEVTHDAKRLDTVKREAMKRGDTFLLLRVEKLRGEPITPDTWRQVANKATSLGKHYDAYRALLHAGDEEKAEALREEQMPDYEPFRPEGK